MAAKIEIVSTINRRQYKRGIKEMREQNRRFGRSAKKSGDILKKAFTVAAVLAVARAIQTATMKVIQYGSKLTDLAAQSRLNTDELQALEDSFRRAGVSVDKLPRVISKLNLSIGQAREGVTTYADAFKNLGISQDQVDLLSTTELLELIAKKFTEAEAGSVEYAAALEILGTRSGAQLQEVLEELADQGLQGLIDQTREAGRLIEADLVQKADAAADRIELLKKRFLTLATVGIDKAITAIQQFAAGLGSLFGGGTFADGIQGEIDAAAKAAAAAQEKVDKRIENSRKEREAAAKKRQEERAAEVRKRLQEIAERVTIQLDTDRFRQIGGLAGSEAGFELAQARREIEIQQRQEKLLGEIAENTAEGGGLAA